MLDFVMEQLYHYLVEETSVSAKIKQKAGICTIMNMNNAQKNSYVRKQILNALLSMLKEQSIEDISVSALVKEAGVGRVSFYRNYESKKDVLIQEERRLFNEWKSKFDTGTKDEKDNFGRSLLNFYKKHSDFYLLLYRTGLQEIIMNTILGTVPISDSDSNPVAYFKSCIAYMIYGYVCEWMKRGMPESGDQLADSLDKIKANMNK